MATTAHQIFKLHKSVNGVWHGRDFVARQTQGFELEQLQHALCVGRDGVRRHQQAERTGGAVATHRWKDSQVIVFGPQFLEVHQQPKLHIGTGRDVRNKTEGTPHHTPRTSSGSTFRLLLPMFKYVNGHGANTPIPRRLWTQRGHDTGGPRATTSLAATYVCSLLLYSDRYCRSLNTGRCSR